MADRAGRWFAALEDEGESIEIRYGFVPAGASAPAWRFLPHDRFDGIGGFVHLLRQSGADIVPPVSRRRVPAPVLRAFREFIHQPRRRWAQWRAFDAQWRPRHPARSRPVAVAWKALSRDSTSAALKRAESCAVSLNSWLLWQLHGAIRSELDSDCGSAWMVPVNVRGVVRLKRDTANHLGFLIVPVQDDDRARDVHRRVRRDLRRGLDVGSWYALAVGRAAGPRLLQDALEAGARRWRVLGTFSNLGAWHVPSPLAAGDWLFCPPTTRFQPLGVGALINDGRLTLTMQAHPALTGDPVVVQRWLGRLVASVEAEPRPLHGPVVVRPIRVRGDGKAGVRTVVLLRRD